MHNIHHLHPKFSIITVTYNAGAVLEDTIQSVITQTYKNVEYIIVDGGSKDRTLQIIEQYKEHIQLKTPTLLKTFIIRKSAAVNKETAALFL